MPCLLLLPILSLSLSLAYNWLGSLASTSGSTSVYIGLVATRLVAASTATSLLLRSLSIDSSSSTSINTARASVLLSSSILEC